MPPESRSPQVTRFAPSPTGYLHLGNARTAFFNHLAARSGGGHLVLRVEDTDAVRSDEELLGQMLADLRWLGLDWAEGPDVGGRHAPYRQSERGEGYRAAVTDLAARGLAYPCFCSPEELKLSRRSMLASGRPPRYAGTCAALPASEVERRLGEGQRPAMRFRVPPRRIVEFTDLVHGAQRFVTDDIGDFVIQRADRSASFFLCNALDDAAMAVTLVLRGDDHLANTPRQILLLEALALPVPRYGHLPLLLGPTGSPLSKREGAASLRDLRRMGYLPQALANYLVRLGHVCGRDAWIDPGEMPIHFDLSRTSRSPARYDEAQLRHWQREAVARAGVEELVQWLGSTLEPLGHAARRREFVEVARGNLLFPSDAEPLVRIVGAAEPPLDEQAVAIVLETGAEFYASAATAWARHAPDFKAWTRAVSSVTGRKGSALYMPLRAALTGASHGPELAPLVALMGRARVKDRLESAASRARDTH
jgi:glutamyl-tRNA synthetase